MPRLSRQLQLGKAAEHLVCADLILQGYSAFLADQGLPYDVLVDLGKEIKRVQVKSSSEPVSRLPSRTIEAYCFNMRRAKGSIRAAGTGEYDYVAFVALDVRKIAYLPASSLVSRDNTRLVQAVWLRADRRTAEELGFRWKIADAAMMRCMDDYTALPACAS